MNVGITTFQWSNNYGAVLQAHALQFFLQERGHTVRIIDYRVKPSPVGLRKWIAKTPGECVRKWESAYKEYVFESFRQRCLVRTPSVFYSLDGLKSIADQFDILITGSDQVWNPQWLSQFDGLFDLYFLSFAAPKTIRISYAASIGHSVKATMKDEWQKILSNKLLELDSISVREPSSVELVQSLCGRTDAVQVIDPTLLLDRGHYEKLTGAARGREKYLFSYMLHGMDQDAADACQQIACSLDLRVIKCDAKTTCISSGYVFPGPTSWLQRIDRASFMVTNSFHGVVFCLIFHTPFVAVLIGGQTGSMNTRIIELLQSVELSHRIISPQLDFQVDLFVDRIDWAQVDLKIIALRSKSIVFLSEQGL